MDGTGVFEVIGTVLEDLSVQELTSCRFKDTFGIYSLKFIILFQTLLRMIK